MPVLQETQEDWLGIYHQDKKIGYVHRRLQPTDAGYRWEEQSRMQLRVLETAQRLHTDVHATLDRHYTLQNFSWRLQSPNAAFQVTGTVTHGADGPVLHGQVRSGDSTSSFTYPWREPLYLPAILPMVLPGTALQSGTEYRYAIFSPLSLRPEIITIAVLGPETLWRHGQEIAVTRVAERFGGTTVHAWLDRQGHVVKEEAALGLVLWRESAEQALADGWQDDTPLDLVTSAAIALQSPLPEPRILTRLRLKVSGVDDPTLFAFPPRQHYVHGTLTVMREATEALATYPLPQTNPEFAAELAATPFLQSTHPRVRAQAAGILRAERDARRAVQLLLEWTYTTLKKAPTVGMPTALAALDSKTGDCNEHAVLFTALARAAGIPARVAAGVVYLDAAFYYHAWAEVWLGQWVAVDPVLDQFPADATHIKLVQGGPEEHLVLLKVMGQIGLEVVDYQ
jgi:hypothetical protein